MSELRLPVVALLAALVGACVFEPDPDAGRFTCAADADCGEGWSCVAQLDPAAVHAAYCFDRKEIVAELCNGVDDDRDGLVDDEPGEVGVACETGLRGECAAGKRVCEAGVLKCVGPSRVAETCNGKDDDCDGQVDEEYDLMNDPANCGVCGRTCEGTCVEGTCSAS